MITVKLDHTMNLLDVDRYANRHHLKIVKFFPGRGKKQHTLLAIGNMPPANSFVKKSKRKKNEGRNKHQKDKSSWNTSSH